jgi:predicted transport protein
MDVFPTQELLSAAKELIQEVVDLIGYDKIEHILAITYRKRDRQISVNLGQWLVLAFQHRTNGINVSFALDSPEKEMLEGLPVQSVEAFASRWAGDKDVQLVQIDWDGELSLPNAFLKSWESAVRLAYQVFKGWTASSYMNYHQPELAQVLVEETERSRHAEYLQGQIGELFEVLRRRILNLDPSVREEFKKLYIAYKTTTNFVDVVPQRSRLRLSLNLKFAEIHDLKGLCKDVSKVGRWGNGDVEVGLDSIKQLDDVMALIHQAFIKHEDFDDSV